MSERDPETSELLAELSGLQTWCVMMSTKDSGGMPAADLIQRTRIHIIELTKGRDFYAGLYAERCGQLLAATNQTGDF